MLSSTEEKDHRPPGNEGALCGSGRRARPQPSCPTLPALPPCWRRELADVRGASKQQPAPRLQVSPAHTGVAHPLAHRAPQAAHQPGGIVWVVDGGEEADVVAREHAARPGFEPGIHGHGVLARAPAGHQGVAAPSWRRYIAELATRSCPWICKGARTWAAGGEARQRAVPERPGWARLADADFC